MSDTTMIETADKRKLGEPELDTLQRNIHNAFRVAPERITKAGQHIILAARMFDGRMLVVLNPDVSSSSSKEQRPVILDSENEQLFQKVLLDVYGRAKNLTVVKGIPLRADIIGKNFADFFKEDYYLRVRKGIEDMTVEWDLEDQDDKTRRVTLQLEVKKIDDIFVENWVLIGKPAQNTSRRAA